MNRYLQEKWPWIEGSHAMRSELLATLSDDDLSFNPGGRNMRLGELWREMGEIEYAYLQSLKTFKTDFSYRSPDPDLPSSIARLQAWFQPLDEEMKALVAACSDEDLSKLIERGGGFSVPVDTQLDIYLQAILIFFGKATIFLKAMNKTLPGAFPEYIG